MRRLVAALALVLALPLAAQEPGAAYRLDQVAVRLDGQAGGAASYAAMTAPTGCVSTSVPFFGSTVKLGCDAELVYNGTTNVLSLGSVKASALTAGRVPIVGTGGLVGDDAGLTYDAATDTLTVAKVKLAADSDMYRSAANTTTLGNGAGGYGNWIATSYDANSRVKVSALGVLIGSNTKICWTSGTYHWDACDIGLVRLGPGRLAVTDGGTGVGALEWVTANGASRVISQVSELVTLSTAGATTDTTADLPANSVLEAVVGRVTTGVTGPCTVLDIGDATTAARFATGVAVALNTTFVGLAHVDQTGAAGPRQTSTAKIRITCDGTPTAGAVRVTWFYRQFAAPST